MFRIEVENLAKRFGHRRVFKDVSFELRTGQSLAIVGPNGSGKSTLVKTLLFLLHPSKGSLKYFEDERVLTEDSVRWGASFVSPYLNLYDQLTGEENLKFFATVSGLAVTGKEIDALLSKVGLDGRGVDYVGEYSSGMKQRLKYAVALLKKPAFLFLDEPTSNLDENGKQTVAAIIEETRRDSIVIVATNEKEEYAFAERLCRIDG